MKSNELKEISIWAVVTMILTVGFFSARAAISQNTAMPSAPRVNIEGMSASATVIPSKRTNEVIVKLTITNPTTTTRTIDWNFNLVRMDFTGNPMSRVMNPSDMKRTIETYHRIRSRIKANSTIDTAWTFKIDSRQPEKSDKMMNIPSYLVEWQGEGAGNGKSANAALTRFSASLAWPQNPVLK